jgi:hypothetical protein
MKKDLYHLWFVVILFFGCQSYDENNDPKNTITSFSGNIQYENGEPVTSAELIIAGSESTLFGAVSRESVMLSIDDGTFEVTLETEEEISRYIVVIDIINGDSERIAFDDSVGLQCMPGENCRNFLPGETHELNIVVPCTPNNCVQLPSNG